MIRARPDDVSGPLTFGWWRPVIVVPHDWSAWPAAHREAALRHERAHIARRDWLVHCAAHLIAAALWFQPLVWLARSRLALAAEHATDDHVRGAGMRPSDYAAALLHIGQRPTARHGLAAGSATATRIRDVLAERPRTTRRWPVLVGAALLCAAALPALAALSPWSPPSEPPQCVDSPPLVFL